MSSLSPIQQEALDWYLALPDSRGVVALPLGFGKTQVGVHAVLALGQKGPSLVVVPAWLLAAQWADRASSAGVSATILDSRNVGELIRARNQASQSGDGANTIWVTTPAMMRSSTAGAVLQQIRWALVVFDEAHQSVRGQMQLVHSDAPTLLLSATPDDLPGDLGLPVYRVPDRAEPRVIHRVVDVQPEPAEALFLEAARAWAQDQEDGPPARVFRNALLARQCESGIIASIDALEAVLAGMSDDSERQLDHKSESAIQELLDLAYAVGTPDSRSTAVVRLVGELDRSRVLMIASLVSQVSYLASLLSGAGFEVRTVTSAMDRDEAIESVRDAHASGSLLLVGDAIVRHAGLEGRNILLHGDLPSDQRIAYRSSLLLDGQTGAPDAITSITVRWVLPGNRPENQ